MGKLKEFNQLLRSIPSLAQALEKAVCKTTWPITRKQQALEMLLLLQVRNLVAVTNDGIYLRTFSVYIRPNECNGIKDNLNNYNLLCSLEEYVRCLLRDLNELSPTLKFSIAAYMTPMRDISYNSPVEFIIAWEF